METVMVQDAEITAKQVDLLGKSIQKSLAEGFTNAVADGEFESLGKSILDGIKGLPCPPKSA